MPRYHDVPETYLQALMPLHHPTFLTKLMKSHLSLVELEVPKYGRGFNAYQTLFCGFLIFFIV